MDFTILSSLNFLFLSFINARFRYTEGSLCRDAFVKPWFEYKREEKDFGL